MIEERSGVIHNASPYEVSTCNCDTSAIMQPTKQGEGTNKIGVPCVLDTHHTHTVEPPSSGPEVDVVSVVVVDRCF